MTTLQITSSLRLTTGPLAGRVFELSRALRIGRHPYNEVSLADLTVSRYHCWVKMRDGGFCVEDLASSNGTYVNGERIQKECSLKKGDLVRVGAIEFLFRESEE